MVSQPRTARLKRGRIFSHRIFNARGFRSMPSEWLARKTPVTIFKARGAKRPKTSRFLDNKECVFGPRANKKKGKRRLLARALSFGSQRRPPALKPSRQKRAAAVQVHLSANTKECAKTKLLPTYPTLSWNTKDDAQVGTSAEFRRMQVGKQSEAYSGAKRSAV